MHSIPLSACQSFFLDKSCSVDIDESLQELSVEGKVLHVVFFIKEHVSLWHTAVCMCMAQTCHETHVLLSNFNHIFSSPEQKVQVSISDQNFSVVVVVLVV